MKQRFPGQETTKKSERERRAGELARRAAAEGMVLLENRGILPLPVKRRLALFGKGARHTVKGGTGSGDVNARETVSVYDGLRGAGYRIVNEDYLDRYDAAYGKAKEEWERQVYSAAGPERDPQKFYRAHASLPLECPEIPISEEDLRDADAAVYVIARISGEAADRKEEKGDYYLSELEERELRQIAEFHVPLVVLLNVGGVMDLSFLEEIPVSALLLMSQAGGEGGNAVADVLKGAVNPCGKLTDSWAFCYEDYPSARTFGCRDQNPAEEYYYEGIFVGYRYFDSFGVAVRYPFGYGGSYTEFTFEPRGFRLAGTEVICMVRVKNTGRLAGKQVAQLYVSCPSGRLVTEQKRLAAFEKSALLEPGASQELELRFSLRQLGVYDEGRAAYLMQKGVYGIYVGEHARSCSLMGKLVLDHDTVTEQLSNICEQMDALKELVPPERLPEEAPFSVLDARTDDRDCAAVNITDLCGKLAGLSDRAVYGEYQESGLWEEARQTAARMTDKEKACLVVGARSALAQEVIGAAAGSVPGAAGETAGFSAYGIPSMVLADGPAGIRVQQQYEVNGETGEIYRTGDIFEVYENRFFGKLKHHEGAKTYYQFATAFPIGTLLAQTFDLKLMEEVGGAIAEEMEVFGVQIWLGPGMNIHRNPLCGRNYEYYSEDPLLSGEMAAAVTRGVQRDGKKGAAIKHFACNNQEDNRMHVTAVISERALREIYLKGFEIAVKKGKPASIMTSYNRVNGVHTANSYDLCTTAARGEWGFCGLIMTDWTTTNGGGSSAAKCISAGNDLIMPGKDSDIREILEALEGRKQAKVTQEQLETSAARLICAARKSEP